MSIVRCSDCFGVFVQVRDPGQYSETCWPFTVMIASPSPSLPAEGPSLGCPSLFIQYIWSDPPNAKARSLTRRLRTRLAVVTGTYITLGIFRAITAVFWLLSDWSFFWEALSECGGNGQWRNDLGGRCNAAKLHESCFTPVRESLQWKLE